MYDPRLTAARLSRCIMCCAYGLCPSVVQHCSNGICEDGALTLQERDADAGADSLSGAVVQVDGGAVEQQPD